MKTKSLGLIVAVVMVCAGPMAMAQVLDLQTGRTADLPNEPPVSVEAGTVIGDVDYNGLRANFKVADKLLLMAGFGSANVDEHNLAVGADAMYQIGDDPSLPVALKFGVAFLPDAESDVTELSLVAIISGAITEKFSWYASGGVIWVDLENSESGEGEDDFAPTIGAGLQRVFSGTLELYAGIDAMFGDFYDDVVAGAGLRMNL